nr:MAG: hypothetical protein DIU67_04210 [Actinomycetota bacterium]
MTSYIGGLASGLDTASMIKQLLDVERVPIVNLQSNRQKLVAKDDAWRDIATRLSALRSSLDSLANVTSLDGFVTASSSDEQRAVVSVAGNAIPQTLSFTIDQLATRHEVVSAGAFASVDAVIGAGTFTIEIGGQAHTVTTDADTTLSQLAARINALGVGVTASVLVVDSGDARLRIVSDATGAASAFEAHGDQAGLESIEVIRAGQDARITMGTLTIARSTNTIDDLIPGVAIDLRSAGAGEVTVSIRRDVDRIVAAVGKVVGDLNNAIGRLKALTAYNAEAKTGGVLLGDSTARQILNDLQTSVSSFTLSDGAYRHAGAIGIEIQRDGTIEFDESKLRAALEDDYATVRRLLSRWGATSDPRAEFVRSGSGTVDGSYEVVVTRAASAAAVTGAAYAAPGTDLSFQIASGARTAEVVVAAGAGIADAIGAINQALAAAGITTITAREDGGSIRLEESRYGSAPSFTVTGSGAFGLDGTHEGVDVAGTIGGQPATGSGRSLTGDTGAVKGLVVSVLADQSAVDTAGGTLALGVVTATGGLIGAISRAVAAAEGTDGAIARAREHWRVQIDLVDDRIARLQDRLTIVEDQLIRQFTAMESMLAQLASQQMWLQAQLAGLTQTR